MSKITIELTEDQINLLCELLGNDAGHWEEMAAGIEFLDPEAKEDIERYRGARAFSLRTLTKLAKAKTL